MTAQALWEREPALILGVVQAIIALAVAFGLHLTPEQVGAILALAAAVVALVTRQHVIPKAAGLAVVDAAVPASVPAPAPAPPQPTGIAPAGEPPTVNLLQEIGLVEAALGDVAAFAAGQPVSGTTKIGNTDYTASVVVLPNGPDAPYAAIGGGFFAILTFALGAAAQFSAGAPVAIAVKEGKTWYGLTLSEKAA